MEIGSATLVGGHFQPQSTGPEKVDRGRSSGLALVEPKQDETKVPPEEVLKKIKSLTGNGQFSVRFEMDQEIRALVVKIYDAESDELVRQIPSEEVLNTIRSLQDFRGMLVDDTL